MVKCVVSILLIVFFSLTPCRAFWGGDIESLIAAGRKTVIEPSQSFEEYLYPFEPGYRPFTDEISYRPGQPDPHLSQADALAEVEYLFNLLPVSYAGYQYFGGDQAFSRAAENLKRDLSRRETIPVHTYRDLLIEHLAFVQDSHFSIGEVSPVTPYTFLRSKEPVFNLDRDGYYVEKAGKRLYLVAVEGAAPEEYLFPSLGDTGEIVYILGSLVPAEVDSRQLNLELQGSEQGMQEVTIKPAPPAVISGRNAYEKYVYQGIPIIELRSMSPAPDQVDNLELFLADASLLHDEEVIILDLRSNQGGAEYFAEEWLNRLFGMPPVSRRFSATLMTDAAGRLLWESVHAIYGGKIAEEFSRWWDANKEESRPGWTGVNVPGEAFGEGGPAVIVLMDFYTASAAETLVYHMHFLEDVLLIGTNTKGGNTFGNVGFLTLPYSGLKATWGISIFLPGDLKLREGRGFEPDLWVDPGDALPAAITLIQRLGY